MDLKKSIKDNYLAHFDIYDLVEAVIMTGTFPNWSAIHSVERFYETLIKLARLDGDHFKTNIDIFIKKSSNLDHLISFLGDKKFLALYKSHKAFSPWAKAQGIAETICAGLRCSCKDIGAYQLFCADHSRGTNMNTPQSNDELIWDEMLDQWSLGMQLSKMELIDLAGRQESEEIADLF